MDTTINFVKESELKRRTTYANLASQMPKATAATPIAILNMV